MTTGFPGPGTYLIFGVILVPVYVMLAAWFLGEPRDRRVALLGVGYLVGLTTLLWGGMYLKTVVIDLLFF
ncbi:hypothetical protein [Natronobiforma cellulositropha]|uniref:hypothetical protein n=1 Tax=Natronobiforma cellulositropha TaxID=1679076 RepID=UPI0021D5EF63|nr:hypothetical protein [Natronobiforma cellulositropha]